MGRDEKPHRAQPRLPAMPHPRVMSAGTDIAAAYRRCEAITRTRAGNFYYGIRLLPAPKRRAMCAVYAFARRVDDIGDGELEPQQKLERLAEQARAVERLALAGRGEAGAGAAWAGGTAGSPGLAPAAPADPVIVALHDASARFPLPVEALGELIEGVRMDVAGYSYERFEDLLLYCRRVAGAIGRLCLAVFGTRAEHSPPDAAAQALADDLGVAMQLTNILRDLREDAGGGRVYLPAEDLRRFGLLTGGGDGAPLLLAALARGSGAAGPEPGADGLRAGASGNGSASAAPDASRLAALVRFEADRARRWFDRGIALTGLLDRRSAACVLAMAGIYERLLERIAADPERALQRRVALAPWEKAWVAVGSMLALDEPARRGRARAGASIGGRG